jgi:hypothetical protein
MIVHEIIRNQFQTTFERLSDLAREFLAVCIIEGTVP